MLSYQHIYHAGNLADVQKHAVVAWIVDYLTHKDKPFTYMETHAGRALYDLSSPESEKTGEARAGIMRAYDWFAPDHPYVRALNAVQDDYGPSAYAGSPMIAAMLMRPTDAMRLAELHPRENAALHDALPMARIEQRDGADMAIAATPPDPRRGMILIDPSWEIKDDYTTIPDLVKKLNRRWNVGIIVLWYPILVGNVHMPMIKSLQEAISDAITYEVTFPPAREGHRMIGSGLFIVNAPWGLDKQLDDLSRRFAAI